MRYDYDKIQKEIVDLVQKACYSDKNKYGSTTWSHHILVVAKHGASLGKRLNADLEVIELAALLHDYAAVVDIELAEENHIHSAKMADEILNKLNFPKEKVRHVKECILNHRGSVKGEHKTIESEVLASADAMSHISEFVDMMFLTFGIHGYKTEEGAEWLKKKIERSWKKMIPEA